MKYILLFTLVLAAVTIVSATPAQATKGTQSQEPVDTPNEDREASSADENRPGSFEETYEGNDREEEYSDLFSAPFKAQAVTLKQVTEDRGAVLVITTTRMRDGYPGDTCAYVTVQIVEKESGKIMATDSIRTCEDQIL